MNSVAQSMSFRVAIAHETDSLREVYRTMESIQVRHVPVVRNGKLVGVLSNRDIFLFASPNAEGEVLVPDVPVKEAMTEQVLFCRTSHTISDVARTFVEKKIECLPVLDANDHLIGMITSTDLLRLLIDGGFDINENLPLHFETQPVSQWA